MKTRLMACAIAITIAVSSVCIYASELLTCDFSGTSAFWLKNDNQTGTSTAQVNSDRKSFVFFDFTGYESQLNAATAITVSANARWSTNLIRDISFFVIDDSLEDKVNTTLTYAQATSDGIWSGGTMVAERTETEAVSSITLNMNTDEVKNAISSGDNSRLLLRIERISSTGGNTELNVASLKCTVTYSADCVSQLAEEMQWSDVSEQSKESVTRNITLPAQYKNCDISWHSDNEAVVGSDGTVIRQSEDATVTLTATLRLGSKTASRSFTITVPKGEPVAEKELYTCAISCSSAYSLINDGRTFSGLQASNDRKSFAVFDFTGYETQLGVAEKITLSAKSLYSTDRIKDIRFVVIDDAMEDKINSSLTYLYAKSDGMWDGGVTVAERTDTSDLATLTIDVNTEKLTNAFSGSGNSLLALRIERASAASGNTIMDPTALTMEITYSSDCVSQLAEGMQWSDVSEQSIDAVTSKLTLPSLYKICGVTWKSDDNSVISADGTVNQKANDRTVALTATLSLGKKSADHIFSVTVPKLDPSFVLNAVNSTESWLRIKEIITVDNSDFFESTLSGSDYDKIKDTDPVFKDVVSKLPYTNFSELTQALADSVARTYKAENTPVTDSRPSRGSNGSSGGSVIITTPAEVDKTANTAPAISFADVPAEHWAYAAVSELCLMGTISGYDDQSFRPQNNITRAEFVKMVASLSGDIEKLNTHTGFADVAPADWYFAYVTDAAAKSLINGTDGAFKPDEYISREDAVLIIYRLLSAKEMVPRGNKIFADRKDISEYAKQAVGAMGAAGIVEGSGDNMFLPKNQITRAESAQLLYNALVK